MIDFPNSLLLDYAQHVLQNEQCISHHTLKMLLHYTLSNHSVQKSHRFQTIAHVFRIKSSLGLGLGSRRLGLGLGLDKNVLTTFKTLLF